MEKSGKHIYLSDQRNKKNAISSRTKKYGKHNLINDAFVLRFFCNFGFVFVGLDMKGQG